VYSYPLEMKRLLTQRQAKPSIRLIEFVPVIIDALSGVSLR